MLFDVPVIPDDKYVSFLCGVGDRLASCHFSLYSPAVIDCRHKFEEHQLTRLIQGLAGLKKIKQYALLNAGLHLPSDYFAPEKLKAAVEVLRTLRKEGVLDGIIYSDQYYLSALAQTDPEMCSELEAVPSVNFQLDSFDKIVVVLEAVERTGCKPPGKLVLDRSLNRRPDRLADISARVRRDFPEIKLSLLANEGCLYHCPYKSVHDAHIALANLGVMPVETRRINQDFGCRRHLDREPWQLFKSPWIRPEDVHRYEDWVQVIKICGRTLGPEFLQNAVTAYLQGFYHGNLLDLTDTMEWLAEKLEVKGHELPPDFFDVLTSCGKKCNACQYCRQLLDRCTQKKDLVLRDLRG